MGLPNHQQISQIYMETPSFPGSTPSIVTLLGIPNTLDYSGYSLPSPWPSVRSGCYKFHMPLKYVSWQPQY
ncbi:hypothetical protein XELAEV_18044676mg [Xenopus laevis]|uniref:Uncharacterized protein n=1 Tax=Xenopus laevis TaxID=8355 RepID=A0A974BZ93_XENLA|nr:hypothetical protein XELAEV_18044676mg [Xenopus laevis]